MFETKGKEVFVTGYDAATEKERFVKIYSWPDLVGVIFWGRSEIRGWLRSRSGAFLSSFMHCSIRIRWSLVLNWGLVLVFGMILLVV